MLLSVAESFLIISSLFSISFSNYLFDLCNLNKNFALNFSHLSHFFHAWLFLKKKEIIDSKEEIILVFRFSVFIFSGRLSLSVSGMVLMEILGVFMRSM